ncbi:hypothetical protein GOSPT_095_00010, partial [Gordonia sputi NBRC 100414]
MIESSRSPQGSTLTDDDASSVIDPIALEASEVDPADVVAADAAAREFVARLTSEAAGTAG